LKEVFDEDGIEVAADKRKKIEEAIHKLTGVDDKDCPSVSKKLKQQVLNDEKNRREFARKLRAEVNRRS
jgi:hypothetical protein